jgi:hypothetical protein
MGALMSALALAHYSKMAREAHALRVPREPQLRCVICGGPAFDCRCARREQLARVPSKAI